MLIKNISSKFLVYGRMIKFEHSLFAFPFAIATLLLANRVKPVAPATVFWILMAVLWARTAAMGFNRLVDAQWDARNPRTSGREIPAGTITVRETVLFVALSGLLFIFSAATISRLCFFYSFPVLFVLFFYSYTKRFTWLSHLVLGFAQSLGPLGVWLAVTGELSLNIVILSFALGTYMTGFDLLYACQDVEFDRREKLCSMPAHLGIERTMDVSSLFHLLTFLSLSGLYWVFDLSPFYLVFVTAIGILLIIEHKIVSPQDLSRIEIAFFHVNSIISLLLLAAMITDELVQRMYS